VKRVVVVSLLVMLVGGVAAGAASAVSSPEIGRCVPQAGGKYAEGFEFECTEKATHKSGKYEFYKGAVNGNFYFSKDAACPTFCNGGAPRIEGPTGPLIECADEPIGGGEYAAKGKSTKEVRLVLLGWEGCKESGGLQMPCSSTNEPTGSVVTNVLAGKFGTIEEFGEQAQALELHPEASGELFAQFTCENGTFFKAWEILGAKEPSGLGRGKTPGGGCVITPFLGGLGYMTQVVSLELFSNGNLQGVERMAQSKHPCYLEMDSHSNFGSGGSVERVALVQGGAPGYLEMENEEPLELRL
jgi:hypothetical protein